MSRAIALIRFKKTGNIYYGCYDGTSDIMYASFTEYQNDFSIFNWCSEHCYDYQKIDKNLINDEDDIEVYSDYGDGFYWDGKGSEEFRIITKHFTPWYNDDSHYIDGKPDWVEEFMVNVMGCNPFEI